MVSEERGTLLEAVLVEVLDRARDRRVDARASVGELRVVGDLLCERVLERIFGVWIQRLLEQELTRDELAQRRLELVPSEARDSREYRV